MQSADVHSQTISEESVSCLLSDTMLRDTNVLIGGLGAKTQKLIEFIA
jgi:hypothetical protein